MGYPCIDDDKVSTAFLHCSERQLSFRSLAVIEDVDCLSAKTLNKPKLVGNRLIEGIKVKIRKHE